MLNFILGLIIGGGAVWFAMRNRGGNPNAEAIEQKEKNLEKVLSLAHEKGEIANDDVQYALGVSDATATRYLEVLERQGKLQSFGFQKATIYRPF